jgi:hypothetical protein
MIRRTHTDRLPLTDPATLSRRETLRVRLLIICPGGALATGLHCLPGAMVWWSRPTFPYGTLAVNVLGTLVIGFIQEVGTTSLLIADTTRAMPGMPPTTGLCSDVRGTGGPVS